MFQLAFRQHREVGFKPAHELGMELLVEFAEGLAFEAVAEALAHARCYLARFVSADLSGIDELVDPFYDCLNEPVFLFNVDSADTQMVAVALKFNLGFLSRQARALGFQPERDNHGYHENHYRRYRRDGYHSQAAFAKSPGGAPGAVSDLAAVADQDGAHKATLTFRLPTVDLEGKPLADAVTSVDISRDGTLVKTVTENLQLEMSVVDDTDPAVGEHTYTVVANNSVGTGVAADVKVFVGFNIPFDVEWVKAIEDPEKPGTVTITWAPADLDIDNKL